MIAWAGDYLTADDYVIASGTTPTGVLIFEPLPYFRRLHDPDFDRRMDEIRAGIDAFAALARRLHTARVRWAADAATLEPLPQTPPPRPAPRVRRRACSVASRYRVAA